MNMNMKMIKFDDDVGYLVMKVMIVKEVMTCDVSPVAMFFFCAGDSHNLYTKSNEKIFSLFLPLKHDL